MPIDSAPDAFPTLLAVLEQSPVGVLLLDADGTVAFENARARDILGDSCLGCTAADLPGLSARLRDAIVSLSDVGTAFQEVEAAVAHADGSRRIVVASGTPVRGADGETTLAVTLADVTERVAGEEAQALAVRIEAAEGALRRAALGTPDALALLESAVAHCTEALGAHVGAAFVGVALGDDAYVRCAASPPDAFPDVPELDVPPDVRAGRAQTVTGLGAPHALLLPTDGAAPAVIALGRDAPFTEAERLGGARLAALFSTLWAWTDAEARFQRTVAGLDDALFTVSYDAGGRRAVVFVTPQVEALTGLDVDAVLAGDADWADLVCAEDRAAFDAHDARLRLGDASRVEARIVLAGGETVWISERATPGVDATGQPVAGGLLSDVTVQKEAEATLDRARRVAERASEARMAFLRLMSHELRTPLGAIRGFAELLADEVAEITDAPPQVTEFTTTIGEAATRALRLVSDLLDLARLETGALDLTATPVDVTPLVRASAARVAPDLAARGIALHVDADDPAVALCDAARFEQIAAQLVGNAAAFTARGNVSIKIKTEADTVRVSVTDTGAGMNEVFLEALFEPFAQEDTRVNRDREGMGLGLAIARRLAEAMDGTLTAESVQGVGSAFVLALPVG